MTSTRVDLPPEEVVRLVDDITGAFLAAPTIEEPAGPHENLSVVARVHVTGAFEWVVVAAVSDGFAALCAGRMLALDEAQVDEAAIVDAVGEMANMIGGSVKALLPEPCTLSLPVVSVGGAGPVTARGSSTVVSVDLRCAGEPLRVSVLTRSRR